MTNDALLVVKCLFGTIWQLFTSWYIPGTMVTPATAALFFAAAGISLRFVLNLFHSPGGSLTGSVITIGHINEGNKPKSYIPTWKRPGTPQSRRR